MTTKSNLHFLRFCLTADRESIIKKISRSMEAPAFSKEGLYHVWKGSHPVALVAHIDTVLEKAGKQLDLVESKGVITNSHGVLGADDRAGIAIMLALLKQGYRPWIIICDLEESGLVGANQLATDYPRGLSDISAMIELDRRGANDVVYYDMDLQTKDAIRLRYLMECQGGFDFEEGTMSDISVLAPEWETAACNVSVGYFHEHTKNEFLVTALWEDAIVKVAQVLDFSRDLIPLSYTSDLLNYRFQDTPAMSSALLGHYKDDGRDYDYYPSEKFERRKDWKDDYYIDKKRYGRFY